MSTDVNNEGQTVQTSLDNSIFSDISTSENEMIVVTKSGISKIMNTTFNVINTVAMKITKSTVSNIEGAIFKNTQQGLILTDSTISNVVDSEFRY